MPLEKITGSILLYTYKNDETMYKVCKVNLSDDKTIIMTGSFPELDKGMIYDFYGEYITHPKYGEQFQLKSYQRSDDFTIDGLIDYLSSDKFPGIGFKLATNITDKLGKDTIKKILEDKNVLDGITGLSKVKKEFLYEQLKNTSLEDEMYIKLYSYGLTSKMITKLYENYGIKACNIIEEDPYRLIYEVEGYGFKKSDALALKLGFKLDDIRRIKAALIFSLNEACYTEGYTYLSYIQLISYATRILNAYDFPEELFTNALTKLIEENKIKCEDELYYDSYLYFCENSLAEKIKMIDSTKIDLENHKSILEIINEVEDYLKITYTDMQKEAIINSLTNKLSIITGGPGTGKSTILKGVLYTYAALNGFPLDSDELSLKVLLASPTGRAAKRMSEVTEFKASTIHKALGCTYDNKFSFDKDNLLPYSLVIIDETSMLDISLAYSLFSALSNKCQVILVGDANQLPSVGPGNVLSDLINTSVFKTTRLNKTIRQALDSNIITLSNMILAESIDFRVFNTKPDLFLYTMEQDSIPSFLIRVLNKYLQTNDNLSNIQILIPMYAGNVGIDEINKLIQLNFNPSNDFVKRGDLLIKKNDRVLQLKNDTSLKVMNGDIGYVIDIVKDEKEDYLKINFDGLIVTYPVKYIDNLQLAYAMSIHKAQGAEFENVIMIIDSSYYRMLKKKVIYTGVTRAKKKLIMIGQNNTLDIAIKKEETIRQTSLANRIKNVISKPNNLILINDPNIPFDTLGEYDMDGISPYSFMQE